MPEGSRRVLCWGWVMGGVKVRVSHLQGSTRREDVQRWNLSTGSRRHTSHHVSFLVHPCVLPLGVGMGRAILRPVRGLHQRSFRVQSGEICCAPLLP